MTANQINTYLVAILTTVAEAEDGLPVPLGPLYAGLMGRIDYYDWQLLTHILSRGGLAMLTAETITITDKGYALLKGARP